MMTGVYLFCLPLYQGRSIQFLEGLLNVEFDFLILVLNWFNGPSFGLISDGILHIDGFLQCFDFFVGE